MPHLSDAIYYSILNYWNIERREYLQPPKHILSANSVCLLHIYSCSKMKKMQKMPQTHPLQRQVDCIMYKRTLVPEEYA